MGFFNTSGSGLESNKELYVDALNYLINENANKPSQDILKISIEIPGGRIKYSMIILDYCGINTNGTFLIDIDYDKYINTKDEVGEWLFITRNCGMYGSREWESPQSSILSVSSILLNPKYVEWFKNNGYGIL